MALHVGPTSFLDGDDSESIFHGCLGVAHRLIATARLRRGVRRASDRVQTFLERRALPVKV